MSFSKVLQRVCMLALLVIAPALQASDLGVAKKEANLRFKNSSFTALADLQTSAQYYVRPDATPLDEKKQGRFRFKLGIGQRNLAFSKGQQGKGIYVTFSKRKQHIKVTLQPKRGPTMHAVTLFIQHDRALQATDLDPRAIARALASHAEFAGFEVGKELDTAVEAVAVQQQATPTSTEVVPAMIEAKPAAPMPPKQAQIQTSMLASSQLTIIALQSVASPSRITKGSEILLELLFELNVPEGQRVLAREARSLFFGSNLLPGFPVKHEQPRSAGQNSSKFSQPIPYSAAAGIYTFKGEVCVAQDCISRTVSFEVVQGR